MRSTKSGDNENRYHGIIRLLRMRNIVLNDDDCCGYNNDSGTVTIYVKSMLA